MKRRKRGDRIIPNPEYNKELGHNDWWWKHRDIPMTTKDIISDEDGEFYTVKENFYYWKGEWVKDYGFITEDEFML